jgi:nitroreductase
MDALDAIFNRRSIRQYKPGHISDENIRIILKAAMHAPSAVNKQPWHFIVFRSREIMENIISFHPNASMLQHADAAILICWDEQLQHDTGYGPIDCAAATQNILLASHSLGIGSVWVGLYPRQQRMDMVHKLFSLPENINPFAIVSLGYPGEKKLVPDRFNNERIHFENW